MGNCFKKPTARARRLVLHKQLRLSPTAWGQAVKSTALRGAQSHLQSHIASIHFPFFFISFLLWFLIPGGGQTFEASNSDCCGNSDEAKVTAVTSWEKQMARADGLLRNKDTSANKCS